MSGTTSAEVSMTNGERVQTHPIPSPPILRPPSLPCICLPVDIDPLLAAAAARYRRHPAPPPTPLALSLLCRGYHDSKNKHHTAPKCLYNAVNDCSGNTVYG